tara:strand:+ start:1819 stop:2610 length:792 start_codon:yes stop_codon:yes gene_type:complete
MYLILNNNKYLEQIVESLLFCLIFNNKECELVYKIDQKDKYNIYIILNINTLNILPKKFIVYNLEQLICNRNWQDTFFKKCSDAIQIFDYSLENIKIFEKYNLKAIHLPYGWSPIIEPEYNISINDKDVDLIFLGNLSDRREKILKNYKVYKSNKCYNEEYDNITRRAKYSLNIHNYTGRTILEVTRIIPLICRGVIIISERSDDKYYDDLFKDICIFDDLNDIDKINDIINNFTIKDCILNKEKLVERLNFVKIVSEKIKLF